MCISKMNQKQLEEIMERENRCPLCDHEKELFSSDIDKICNEAIKIERGIVAAEIKSYDKFIKYKHYEPLAYGPVDLDVTTI